MAKSPKKRKKFLSNLYAGLYDVPKNYQAIKSPWYFRFVSTTSGFLLGAALGSIIPGLGTVVGGLIGGAITLFIGRIFPGTAIVRDNAALAKAQNLSGFVDEEQRDPLAVSKINPPYDLAFFTGAGGGAMMGPIVEAYLANPSLLAMDVAPHTLLGAALGTMVLPGIGTAIGAAIGIVLGLAFAFGHTLYAAHKRGRDRNKRNSVMMEELVDQHEPKRELFKQSKHNIPIYVRAFFGLAAGALIGTALFPGIGSLIGVTLGFFLAVLSPLIFDYVIDPLIVKPMTKFFKKIQQHWNNWRSNKQVSPTKSQTTPNPHRAWYKQSNMDIPWYIRTFAGAFGGLALGLSLGFVGLAMGPLGLGLVVLGAAVAAIASPFFFKALEKLGQRLFPRKTPRSALAISEGPPKWHELSRINIPWYIRFATSAFAGMTLGAAIGTLIAPGVGTIMGMFIGAVASITGALLTPMIQPQISRFITWLTPASTTKPTTHDPDHALFPDLPWYVRLFAGAMGGGVLGMMIGAVIGTFLLPGLGTMAGAMIGSAIGSLGMALSALIDPIMTRLKNTFFPESRVKNSDGLFTQMKHAFLDMSVGAILGAAIGTLLLPGIGSAIGAVIGAAYGMVTPLGVHVLTKGRSRRSSKVGDTGENASLAEAGGNLAGARIDNGAGAAAHEQPLGTGARAPVQRHASQGALRRNSGADDGDYVPVLQRSTSLSAVEAKV